MELVPSIRDRQRFGSSEKLKLVHGSCIVEQIEEFSAENDAERMNVKEEVGSCRNPARTVEG